jgi:Cdc6-like AAA superfamily ATPase
MAIEGINEDDFRQILASYLSPARAISDPAHLRGRQQRLRAIDRAFNSPGKHVFIYGDRGVGKTSLAQSAAVLHQSSDAKPILIACDQFADFYKMVAAIVQNSISIKDAVERPNVLRKGGLRIPGLTGEMEKGLQSGVIPPIESLNDAVVLLKYVSEIHSKDTAIVIDEFDQISNDNDRKRFADLIKQISDQEVGVRFIFCGIGPSLETLIGVHLSTDRYITPIELERLSHDALWEILTSCAAELGIEFGHEELIRISQISDGFPYYVHLIGEHTFWSIFDDAKVVDKVGLRHFDVGIRGAIAEAVGSLKQAYNIAVQKRADDYEEVLWAVAESPLLERKSPLIYEESYIPIMRGRKKRDPIDIKTFYQRMNLLKTLSHGCILKATPQGWYRFSENVMRGYVRLKAEEAGVHLGIDHHLAHKRENGSSANPRIRVL